MAPEQNNIPRTTGKDPASYKKRTYRKIIDPAGLFSTQITIRETDLQIMAGCDVSLAASHFVILYRSQLENYLHNHPVFLSSLRPLEYDPLAPALIKSMLQAAESAGVGPMAAVAGTIAEYVGQDLIAAGNKEIIIENGGDIFMARQQACQVAVFAGESPLSYKIGIKIAKERMPLGVCTSSGTVGHSLSFGRADSVTVLAPSTPLADAAATRLANELKDESDINHCLEVAQDIRGISGVIVIKNEKLGVWGEVELVTL
jgi:ApbE superfamily uncharacterized protein (UPF0280 family)